MPKKKLTVDGLAIAIGKEGYVSLTDIAKRSSKNKPKVTIQSWLKNSNTISFLVTWEKVHNPSFKGHQMLSFREFAADNRNAVNAKTYIAMTGAVGITSSAGRYGGTYAHSDIALDFCRWLSPEFSVYLNQEFQRLKAEEQLRLGDPYNIKRHLASGNYSLLVSAILSQTDERLLTHPQPYKRRLPIASESDMLNKIVFGNTAKEWRLHNTNKPTDRNQRDYASILDLTILNNLEYLDSMLIHWGVEKEERKDILQEAYDIQYATLKRSVTIKRLQAIADRQSDE